MDQIYLDRDQCSRFGVEYFGADSISLRADVILGSKDYDKQHQDYLGSFGVKVIHLTKTKSDSPGWYSIT